MKHDGDRTLNMLGNNAKSGGYGGYNGYSHGVKAQGYGAGIAPQANFSVSTSAGPQVTGRYGKGGYGYFNKNTYQTEDYSLGGSTGGQVSIGGKSNDGWSKTYDTPSVHGFGEVEVSTDIETGPEMETEGETEVQDDKEVGTESEVQNETELNVESETTTDLETGVESEINGEMEAELETEHADDIDVDKELEVEAPKYKQFEGLAFPNGVNGMSWNPKGEPEFKSGRAPPEDFAPPENPFANNGFGSFGGFSNNLFSSKFNGW